LPQTDLAAAQQFFGNHANGTNALSWGNNAICTGSLKLKIARPNFFESIGVSDQLELVHLKTTASELSP
jgi:hypothetical protein